MYVCMYVAMRGNGRTYVCICVDWTKEVLKWYPIVAEECRVVNRKLNRKMVMILNERPLYTINVFHLCMRKPYLKKKFDCGSFDFEITSQIK